MIDESVLEGFVDRLSKWVHRLPNDVMEPSDATKIDTEILNKVRGNCEAVSKADGVLRSLASVLDSESLSAEEFVKAFASVSDPVLQAQSRLPQASQLQAFVPSQALHGT